MNPKVVIYKWELGVLKAVQHEFEKIELAVAFFEKHIEEHIEHQCKVFDCHGHLTHSGGGDCGDPDYA